MFHEGDLQSGIGLAVQQAKAVLCFVHGEIMLLGFSLIHRLTESRPDESDTSNQWESILQDDAVSVSTNYCPEAHE